MYKGVSAKIIRWRLACMANGVCISTDLRPWGENVALFRPARARPRERCWVMLAHHAINEAGLWKWFTTFATTPTSCRTIQGVARSPEGTPSVVSPLKPPMVLRQPAQVAPPRPSLRRRGQTQRHVLEALLPCLVFPWRAACLNRPPG